MIESSEYVLTVEAPDIVPIEAPELEESIVFSDADAFIIPDQQEGEVTEFESQVIAAVLAGDMGYFASPFINSETGMQDFNLWWSAYTLHNDLIANGIAPADYEATAAAWFTAL